MIDLTIGVSWSCFNPFRSEDDPVVSLVSEGVMLGDVNNETIGHANLKNRSERTESLKRK